MARPDKLQPASVLIFRLLPPGPAGSNLQRLEDEGPSPAERRGDEAADQRSHRDADPAQGAGQAERAGTRGDLGESCTERYGDHASLLVEVVRNEQWA